MLETEKTNYEKCVLIGLVTRSQSEEKMIEYLDELEFLFYVAKL